MEGTELSVLKANRGYVAKHSSKYEEMSALCVCCKFYGQATKSMRGDALAQVGDEGRDQLR